eukprot:172965-Pyramimonas_sp.AAC.1
MSWIKNYGEILALPSSPTHDPPLQRKIHQHLLALKDLSYRTTLGRRIKYFTCLPPTAVQVDACVLCIRRLGQNAPSWMCLAALRALCNSWCATRRFRESTRW